MTKNCAFTICSKNYLAQAFTLKESFKDHNSDKDFFIFLADKIDETVKRYDEVIQLSSDFIPKWEEMAFKYSVIEFNTSIKPFCFNKLFKEGYEKVVYLDPDIYVVDSLDCVFADLNEKDMVITPHCTQIQEQFSGAVSEEELLFVGIYNLGFGAIKNSQIGNTIVRWWMNRLEERCFADKLNALHVDQKWIDFLPGFFPDNIKISHHLGYNTAIWNLFERDLVIHNGKYFIQSKSTQQEYPLIFYHFSGFDPDKPDVINRRQPEYNVTVYPTFKAIIDEYKEKEFKNDYYYYTFMKYDFQNFDNGNRILPFHRRIYNNLIHKGKTFPDPFNSNGMYYKLLRKNKLLSDKFNDDTAIFRESITNKSKKKIILQKFYKIICKLLKADKYQLFLNASSNLTSNNSQEFLLNND